MDVLSYIAVATLFLLAILILAGAYVVFCIAIKSASGKEVVFGKSHKEHKTENEKKLDFLWIEQVQQPTIKSRDGYNLSAYEVFQSPSSEWFICIHGYSGNATNMVTYMDHLVKLGYNILSVDLRGHGRSEGKYYGLGYLDQFDIAEWIDYATNKSQCDQVNLFGISMGGATALMAAAYTPDRVSKIITDSAPADFVSMFTRILSGKLRVLTPFVIGAVSLYNRIFVGYWLRDASAASVVSKITAPVLFIHGQSDGFVPVSMGNQLYDKCVAPKKRLIIENADHTSAVHINSELYWDTIEAFLAD